MRCGGDTHRAGASFGADGEEARDSSGRLAACRLPGGEACGEMQSWAKPVDALRGLFADAGSTPAASTKKREIIMRPSILLKQYQKEVVDIIRSIPGVQNLPVFVFGSVARGTDHDDSDIDIMIETPEDNIDQLEIFEAQGEISDLLGCSVEIALSCRFKDHLYEKIKREGLAL